MEGVSVPQYVFKSFLKEEVTGLSSPIKNNYFEKALELKNNLEQRKKKKKSDIEETHDLHYSLNLVISGFENELFVCEM